jgi:hypothetical protein
VLAEKIAIPIIVGIMGAHQGSHDLLDHMQVKGHHSTTNVIKATIEETGNEGDGVDDACGDPCPYDKINENTAERSIVKTGTQTNCRAWLPSLDEQGSGTDWTLWIITFGGLQLLTRQRRPQRGARSG